MLVATETQGMNKQTVYRIPKQIEAITGMIR